MNTRSLITFIQKEAKDWSRSDILTLLNEVQRIVFSQKPNNHMRVINTSSEYEDPALTTTSGTYEYTIDTSNGYSYDAAFITAVYTDSNGIEFPEDVQLYAATPAEGAKIVFKENPGTTTYYMRVYKLPSSISSEAVNLSIPHAYHLTHVVEGVLGYIEKAKSGESRRWEMFKERLLPEIVRGIDSGNTHIIIDYKGY